jgi:hypothetical protein
MERAEKKYDKIRQRQRLSYNNIPLHPKQIIQTILIPPLLPSQALSAKRKYLDCFNGVGKLTVNTQEAPPSAIDSSNVGFLKWLSDIILLERIE